jgi:hypothetical protein
MSTDHGLTVEPVTTTTPAGWPDQKPHVLTITCAEADKDGQCECEKYGDDHSPNVTVECPGDSPVCRTYRECDPCNKTTDPAVLESLGRDGTAHGEDHMFGEYRWMAESGECWVATSDEEDQLTDAVRDMFKSGGVQLGRFQVTVEDGDPLTLAPAGSAAAGVAR